MKLAYLAQVRLPTKNAHGFQIMNMCSALAEIGVDVELWVPWRRNLLREDPFTFYKTPENFKIIRFPAVDLYWVKFLPEKIINLIHLFSFLLSARIRHFFDSSRIIYTREKWVSCFFKEFIYEVHMPEQLEVPRYKPRKVVVLNEHIKQVFLQKGLSENNILVAPDAVNPEIFTGLEKKEARKRVGLQTEKPIILYWGNFKEWKGVDTLAEAAKFMPDHYIVLIGATKTSDLERIKDKVKRLNNVLVEGFRPQELMPAFLESSDILILPNTAKDENSALFTSPLKLFEYMASGRPIVASNLPSLREILSENNAVFFEPDSPESLAKAITSLINDPDLQQRISLQAKKDVSKYTWRKRAGSIIDLLKK